MHGGHPRFLSRLCAVPVCPVLALFTALAWGCAVDLGFEKRDGWPDVVPDETGDDQPDPDADADVPTDDGPPPECGNGEIEAGEECDGDPDRACTTECDTEGTEHCVDCAWVCEPPPEICNEVDDDCDDRIDESGLLTIEHGPTRVTNDPGASEHPALAWSSTDFGLVWQDDRAGHFDLYSAILGPDAAVAIAEHEMLAAMTNAVTPSAVWANDVFNVVFTDTESGGTADIVFQRMDGAGDASGIMRVVANEEIVVLHGPVLVERTGGGFVVVWDESFTVTRALTTARGVPSGLPVELDEEEPDVSRDADIATSGAGFGVVWVDERDGNAEIYAAVLDAMGGLIVTDVRLTVDGAASEQPAVVWDGSTYAVAWADARPGERDIFFTRFNSSGTEIGWDVQVHTTPGPVEDPDLVWTTSEFAIAWSNDGEIRMQILEDSGAPMTGELTVSESGGDSTVPCLVWTGSTFGLAWQDTRDGNAEIYLAVVVHEECP